MEQVQEFKFIDTTFTAAQARMVLLNLIDAKINFHSLRRLSDQERYGADQMQSAQRITELRDLERDLNKLLDEAKQGGYQVKVHSTIQVSLLPAEVQST